jgi:hypothetical protein
MAMPSELAPWVPESDGTAPAAADAGGSWLRVVERLLPAGVRLSGSRYFRSGVDRAACRAVHGAAARGSLYGFAPPPHFTPIARGRGRRPVDVYRGRAPLVSGLAGGGEMRVHHHRGSGTRGTLVVVNRGAGAFADRIACRLARQLAGVGFDVAIPFGAGEPGDREWNRSVGTVLATIVRRVHDGAAVEAWGRQLGYRSVIATGIGLGGTATALLAATTSRFETCVPILAGAHPGRLWLPPRALARATDLAALARDDVRQARTLLRLFDPVAPSRLPPPRRRGSGAVVGFRYDSVVFPAEVQALADHWHVRPVWLARCRIELPASMRALATVVAHTATTATRAAA